VFVVCHLSAQSLAQVHRAFPPPHRVANVAAWDALLADLRNGRGDVAIVDPCAGGDRIAASHADALASLRPLLTPIVAYVSVTASAMHAVIRLVRAGSAEIVIRGVDDSAEMLEAVAHRAIASWAAERLVSEVGAPFDSLPPEVLEAIRFAFVRPDRVRSVEDLAASARTTRRSLDRWLARAGIASARTLLSCARATAAYHLIAVGNIQKRRAAALSGYSSARSLTRGLRDVAGKNHPIEPDGMSRGRFMAAVRRRLVREFRSRAWGSLSY
jgi:hypothetical protein